MTGTAARPLDDESREDISPEIIAEQAVVGTALQSPGKAADALAALSPDHFYRNSHRAIMEALERLVDAGDRVKPDEWLSAVLVELARDGVLGKIGAPGMGSSAPFLHSLMQRAGDIGFHAPVVLNAARQRKVLEALRSAEFIASGRGFKADTHLEQIRQLIDDASGYSAPNPLRPNSEAVYEVLAMIEAGGHPGLSTGFADLDDVIGGLRDGEMTVFGARPATGKTLIGVQIADHVGSKLGLPVLYASLEMTEHQLTMRRIAATASVPLSNLVRGQATESDWERINSAQARLTNTQLHVDDTSGATLAHVRSRLRGMERAGSRARLLVVDYLGIMGAPRAESRQQSIAVLARGIRETAREFGIPAVLLAQLNRGPEQRTDKMPTVADLRESGEIEQTADIVILLHRPDAYEKESPRAGELDLLINKNRQGAAPVTVTLLFQGHYGRVVPLARGAWSPSAVAKEAQ